MFPRKQGGGLSWVLFTAHQGSDWFVESDVNRRDFVAVVAPKTAVTAWTTFATRRARVQNL